MSSIEKERACVIGQEAALVPVYDRGVRVCPHHREDSEEMDGVLGRAPVRTTGVDVRSRVPQQLRRTVRLSLRNGTITLGRVYAQVSERFESQ
jgi:hypothetical protein